MASEKEIQRRVQVEMNRCVHFNGVMNDECDAGVNYHGLMGTGFGCFAHMPCFNDEATPTPCSKATFPTERQARQQVGEHARHVEEFIKQLNSSTCPICKVQVKQRQVGPCVYGSCGHQLYQGKVNPEFADKEARMHSRR